METDPNLIRAPKIYEANKDLGVDLWQNFLRFAGGVFNFFSLRTSKQFWGIVYDSVNKQPLDPVIVKLLYTDGREVETAVTDLGGRYGFLAQPGKFKIHVRKTNYIFPSRYAAGNSDGIFDNLYHGEFFILKEDSEVVAPNIPMDPVKFDWNQQAKQVMFKNRPYLKLFFKRLIEVFFWFGLILNSILLARFHNNFQWLYLSLGIYLLTIFAANVLPEARLWGEVIFEKNSYTPKRIFLELHSPMFAGISFGKAMVHENSRFLLRAGSGNYVLSISEFADNGEKVFMCSMPVRIGKSGVLSSSIRITSR